MTRALSISSRLRVVGCVVLFALALMVGGLTAAHAETITVEGNVRVDKTTIQSYVSGQPLDVAKKDLLATGLFQSVEIVKNGDVIVVRVKENNIINRVAFEGTKRIKSEMFDGELQLKPRGTFSQEALDADVARIKEIYARVGRSNIEVTPRVVPLDNGKIDVVFKVDEGTKTGVKSIDFVGNASYSSGRLRDEMQTTQSNFLSWIKTTDIYDPDRLAADGELIRRFYLRHGYADMRILDTKVDFDQDAGGYRIVISIEEGRQYKVGDIDVESKIDQIDAATLRARVQLQKGDVYNADLVDKSILGITTEVASRGYAFSQVRPRGDRDTTNGTIKLSFLVEEGPRVYIERINVRGNTRTRDYVIRREFDIGEGDAYNKVMIDRTERRLRNLGFFKSVRISNEPGSTPDRVIINVDVEDQSTGQFSVGGGYSTTEGILAEVGIQESNLMGRGQFARLRASTGQWTKGVEFNFTEPYFMDRRIAAGFDLYSKQSDNTRYAYYTNMKTGGTLRMGVPLTEETSITGRYSLYDNQITVSSDKASTAIKQSEGQNLTSAVGYTIEYNTLDNNASPRNGVLSNFKQDLAGLGGDSRYIRSTTDMKLYRELNDTFVGMLRGQAGYVTGPNLLVIDNFFMGPDLVRGFALSGIGPRDGGSSNPALNGLGGTTYWGSTAEVTFPFFGLPRETGIRGAVYADAGSVFGYSSPAKINNIIGNDQSIRTSVGTGVLWASPIGPIRLDFAVPLNKNSADQVQNFRFTAGSVF